MNSIKYHEHYIQHAAIRTTKRMLNRIDKKFGGFHGLFNCNITLTGVPDIDIKEIRYTIKKNMESLSNEINKQIFKNEIYIDGVINEEYDPGYQLTPLNELLKLISQLTEVSHYIGSSYPQLEVKKSDFIFSKNLPEENFNDSKLHFKLNPVIGFSLEYFAILENGKTKRLFPLTFSPIDLFNSIGIRVTYF